MSQDHLSAPRESEANSNISKEWLDIDGIEDIDKSEESRNSGWKELVIPHKFSELLLSLVSNHISDVRVRQWEALARHEFTDQIDLVRGKGRGLIILLHGQSLNPDAIFPGLIFWTLRRNSCVQELAWAASMLELSHGCQQGSESLESRSKV